MSQLFTANSMEGYFHEGVNSMAEAYLAKDISPSIDQYTSTATLHHLRVKTACLDSILHHERERYARKKIEFTKRWENAAKTLRQVDVTITNFEHVYKENLAEVSRLTIVASREDERREAKQLAIQRLNKEKAVLEQIKNKTKQRLENYIPVRKYLSNVIHESRGEFRNERELIERSTLLLTTRAELMARNDAADAKYRRLETNIQKTGQVKANEAILLNNYIFDLSQNLSDGEALLRQFEEEVARVKTTASNRTMILSQIKTSVFNIYVQMCKKLKVDPEINAADTVKQVTVIKSSMMELIKMKAMIRFIIKKARERAAAETAEHERRNSAAAAESAKAELKEERNGLRELFGLEGLRMRFISKADEHAMISRLMKRTQIQESQAHARRVTNKGH